MYNIKLATLLPEITTSSPDSGQANRFPASSRVSLNFNLYLEEVMVIVCFVETSGVGIQFYIIELYCAYEYIQNCIFFPHNKVIKKLFI